MAIFGEHLVHLSDYRDVVYVAEHHGVAVPEELLLEVLSGLQPPATELQAVSARIETSELPDVAGQMEAHRRKQETLFEDELARMRAEFSEATSWSYPHLDTYINLK